MRSLSEQFELLLGRVRPLEPLALPLLDARGCVAAADVVAPIDLPAVHMCEASGYAARAADITTASSKSVLSLRELGAGLQLAPGSVIPVAAGAPLPPGADCVIPADATDRGTPVVRVSQAVRRGGNVLQAGADIRKGTTVVSVGTLITARHVGLLAAIGVGRLQAYPRPRVAVITTGSELLDPAKIRGAVPPGHIVDIDGPTLACAVVDAGALSYRVGPIPDDPAILRKVIDDQLGRADMVVTTGGIGMDPRDVLRPVLATMGTVDFAWIALEPGQVQGVGSLGSSNVPLLALPGDPAASVVSFELFVRPVVRRLMGRSDLFRPRVEVPVGDQLTGRVDVTSMVPVRLDEGQAWPNGHGVRALLTADGLAILAPGVSSVAAGSTVQVMLLRDEM